MLEGLATYLLNNYVGKYVENLNTKQLSIALLQGYVELENLPLKRDALSSLDLPLHVKSGFIGKIKLQVPLNRLSSEPWVISMKRLYLVAGPVKHSQFNEEKEKEYEEAKKKAMLQALEEKWKIYEEKKETYGSSWFSYGASIATNILENLQLNVEDVHIRYEDDELIPDHPFAFGIVIKSLSAQSTYSEWRSNAHSVQDIKYKLVDLQNFSLYLDTEASLIGDLPRNDLYTALQSEKFVSCKTKKFKEHDYILSPVSAQTKLKRNTSSLPLRSPDNPRINMDVCLETVSFCLSDGQYQCIIEWLKEMERYERRRKNRKWRPAVKVKNGASAWWRYAINATLYTIHERKRKHTKEFMTQRVKNVCTYHRVYSNFLQTHQLNAEDLATKTRLETEMKFDELKILRELAYYHVKKEGKLYKIPEPEKAGSPPPTEQGGILQRWFPGWGGWYGSTQTETVATATTVPASQEVGEPPTKLRKDAKDQEIEQELMDMVQDTSENTSFLKKDTVFAYMNFKLESGVFKLLTEQTLVKSPTVPSSQLVTMMELECSTINILFESRPRSKAMKFGVNVGGLYLRDRFLENSIFPNIIAPQPKERILSLSKSPQSSFSSQQAKPPSSPPGTETPGDKIFNLFYEKNPVNCAAKYRLNIQTKPLDVVYNPASVKRVREFFTTRKLSSSRLSQLKLTATARQQIQQIKERSKAELKHALEDLLEGEEGKHSRWDIDLDISAPQIMVPENFSDQSSNMMVLDLGHLHFYNRTADLATNSQTEEEDDNGDDFQTPMSTPPSEVENEGKQEAMETDDLSHFALSEAQLYNRLYERYSLDLSDLQVMVGKPRDNWKHIKGRGITHLHVVDKFSINLHFERRLLHTTDPEFPSMIVSGNLPSLTLHVNEQKVTAVRKCVDILTTPTAFVSPYAVPGSESGVSMTESISADLSDISSSSGGTDSRSNQDKKEEEKTVSSVEESRLLWGQFTISSLKLEIHSFGKPLAELQVTHVMTCVTKRPFDTAVKVSVHSLLIVDALQTYGPDFELLVASHKHVTLDSKSGSLLGSDPSSPMSATSPNYPQSPVETLPQPSYSSHLQTVQEAISTAIHSLWTATSSSGSKERPKSESSHSHMSATVDSEALIKLDVDIIEEDSPSNDSGCPLKVANIQFNSLDVIGNCETMMEMVNFVSRLSPSKVSSSSPGSLNKSSIVSNMGGGTSMPDKIEVTADFSRLNFLVMKIEEADGIKQAHKVATATMSSARVQATIDKHLDVLGSLGGFHIMDVSSEDIKHQHVFSVGSDTALTRFQELPVHDIMYKTAQESMFVTEQEEAFSFHLLKGMQQTTTLQNMEASPRMRRLSGQEEKLMNVNLKMASICYVHSPKLLHDIADCFSDFKEYTSSMATTIKSAASEVATKIVNKRASDVSMLGSLSNINDSTFSSNLSLDETSQLENFSDEPDTKIVLSAELETPVIVIPRTSSSSEVLVAHLGNISINNHSRDTMQEEERDISVIYHDRLSVEARDTNLYVVDIDNPKSKVDPSLDQSAMYKSVYNQSDCGVPIMHDTTLEIVIDLGHTNVSKEQEMETVYLGEETLKGSPQSVLSSQNVIEIMAKISKPIKLELSKGVYEQVLETVDNLTYDEKTHGISTTSSSATTPSAISSSASFVSARSDKSRESLPDIPEDIPKTSETVPSKSDVKSEDAGMITKLFFEVPLFNVELKGDFDEGEKGLVDLKLHNFSMEFEKSNPYSTNIEIQLQSLTMEDLLVNSDSQYKYLLKSRVSEADDKEHMKPKLFLSHSCPDSTILMPTASLPSSLPSSFHDNLSSLTRGSASALGGRMAFQSSKTTGLRKPKGKDSCPQTPPPSLRSSRRSSVDKPKEDDLVHIKVQLIDKNSPEYSANYNRTNRFIDVDFNCLDANVNLQTWVVLLDFLGMGAKIPDASQLEVSIENDNPSLSLSVSSEPSVNSVVNLKVKSFTLILNKPEYELSRANVELLSANVNLRDENMAISGQLGNLSLIDRSPHGNLYQERFVTVGDQALVFDIFKYGPPDPNLVRDCDISVKLQMASVRYIHTNRFQMEFVAFLQHFLQLQDVLGRYRAASAGKRVTDKASRGSRIKLDINADSPIILLPHSSKTTDILVADLGKLTVNNCFIYDGEPGTLTYEQDDSELMSTQSRESLSSKALSETSDFSIDSSSAATTGMTQSLFNSYNPPMGAMANPMLQSIYGSLEQDQRSPGSEVREECDIYDPTEMDAGSTPRSPRSPEGSSVDPEFFPDSSSWFSSSNNLTSQHRLRINDSMREGKIKRTPSNSSLNRPKIPKSEGDHICLLDIMNIHLKDMNLYSAERVNKRDYNGSGQDLEFKSFVVQKQGGSPLKEKIQLTLAVERNLEGDISHSAPDFRVKGVLSSVHCSLDVAQYKLVRGILDHNLGEKLPEFRHPLMSHLMDPVIETVLSGTVWQGIAMAIDLNNVTVELLLAHADGQQCPEQSLAKLDFICSTLRFDSFSDQSKDIDLVSNEIVMSDTRFRDAPVNVRPNVFEKILQPGPTSKKSKTFQLELHYRATQESNKFSVILNNMKVMCIFDWILSVRDFIMESPEDPFIMEKVSSTQDVVMSSPEVNRQTSRDSTKTTSPLTVSSGIMTKRGPIVEEVEVPFELKLNVSDTQFIVVEDSTTWDTNAVILKSTAILNFRPKAKDKILTCTLQSLEVFSCSLTAEEETAQSIIDPLTIHIDLNANPLPKHKLSSSIGLLEASQVHQNNLVLEITFNVMNIRLSYIDMKMFLAILNSIPEQALKATQHEKPTDKAYPADKVSSLHDMGFSMEDCKKALDLNKMNLMEAAVWLTENAVTEERSKSENGGLDITGMEIKSSSVCVCLIDDCGDSDVPLAEISFNSIQFSQQFLPRQEGCGSFILMGDYYNRKLSGWEPFLEQWKCRCEWKQYYQNLEKKTAIQINAQEVLNLNITSTLLELYNQTKMTWSEDYYKQIVPANSQNQPNQASRTTASCQRRRVPFVPFVLSNDTGCTLWFTTVTTTPRSGRRKSNRDDHYIKASEWKKVESGEKMPFFFHNKEKNRHEKTHELSINQLVVKVDGWMKLSNVTVDRVGVYFRHAEPDVSQAKGLAGLTYSSKHDPSRQKQARLVFDVKQEGKARKLITVRSALIVHNELDSSIDLKMATDSGFEGKFNIMEIPANGTLPLPLPYVSSMLYVRPSDWPVKYCNQPIQWQHVGLAGEVKERIMKCDSSEGTGVYRFCVSVKRENYPEQLLTENSSLILPGHTVSIRPPVIIRNLLPIELRYYIKGTQINGTVKAGEKAYLHAADPQQTMELGLNLENFPTCKELVVPPVTTGPQYHKVKIRLYDTKKRLLELLIKIIFRNGGSVSIHVTAPYWLVNKSGLPLVFRQDFSQQDAAGQYEEHELARSVTPLLFCYAEKDLPNLCTMRVGKSVQGPDCVPVWCKRFSLESGTGMRRLNVVPKTGNRPDWVYNIGIGVHQGKGLYADTNIVTFAPLYEIDNQSSHKLAIAQRHLTQSEKMKLDNCLIALPQCKLPFHWPRLDLDQLLCVNLLDVGSCSWSGGFRIDKTDSFHINIRDDQNMSHLLKVEIVMEGPTYFIVFGDAGEVPPPIRIDNLAEVPVEYFQSETTEQKLRAFVQPHAQVPYAWDEPMLSHSITLRVKGGTSATYNMDKLEEGKQLCYPNFIYLTATSTCGRSPTENSPHRELVLEVVQDQYIKFCKKEHGNRNQLWRMTSGGMLEHEGSISPRDPHNRSSYPSGKSMVLDIDDIAPRPGRIVPLTLRKRDERRKATQTWKFTEDGRLCCVDGAMCVQTLGGVECLRDSAVAVVGPGPPSGKSVPAHMKIDRQRLLPGSGCLTVRTVMDGPIRVLQITDILQGSVAEVTKNYQDWVVCEEDKVADVDTKAGERKSSLEICMSLKGGLGISLVNYTPEELVYISLQNISLDYISNPNYVTVDVAVANVQVDNQLFTATRPVLLYVTPTPRRDVPENTPALNVAAQKIPNSKWNAEIYKHLIVNMKKLSIQIEEQLLWKLLQFCGFGSTDHLDEKVTEGEDTRKALAAATSVKTKRYYFGLLKIHTSRINLSMLTASKLSPDLKALKRDMSLPLVRFEDAKVDLDPFIKSHLFETIVFLQKEIGFHYTEELKSQAAKILGSVDFLGNPLGLFNDVTEGISGLINDGNVGGLLKNVTHGVSNSAAKVVGSLSDGLGTLNMDKHYQDRREQLRTGAQSSGGHILAGVKGFGNGLFGAVTSIFTQPYDGFKEDGIEGLVTGIGKGVIGTVTKPVVGVLDLASGAANAIRDTSSSSSRISPPPIRLPRCCHGAGMLLPPYSQNEAKSQKLLHDLNKKNLDEFFIAVEQLRREDRLMSLITSKQVYFLLGGEADSGNIILKVPHKELFQCLVVEIKGRYYLELVRLQTSASDQQRVPQIRCDKQTVAERVSQQINYARNLYEEQQHTLTSMEAEDT